jgi:hypothetical protein
MPVRPAVVVAAIQFTVISLLLAVSAGAQELRRFALKNDETIELQTVYYISSCRSIMIGLPEIEVLEGPKQVKLSIKEEPVLPRAQGCAEKVPGGKVMLTAEGVSEATEAKLTYRVKYKTKDGDRQTSRSFIVSLFP